MEKISKTSKNSKGRRRIIGRKNSSSPLCRSEKLSVLTCAYLYIHNIQIYKRRERELVEKTHKSLLLINRAFTRETREEE